MNVRILAVAAIIIIVAALAAVSMRPTGGAAAEPIRKAA